MSVIHINPQYLNLEMGKQKSSEQLAKLLSYILERRPDEFGLVLDGDGYVRIRELLKAVWEEGWRHVRGAAIDEMLITLPNPPFETSDNRIRAKNRECLPGQVLPDILPKLLYTCARKKAHAFVLEKGIFPGAHPRVILSSDRGMAERMGKRSDQSPIILTVQVRKSENKGVVFHQAGETLYLADFIPPDCFTAPPLPKQKIEAKKQEKAEEAKVQKFPGSFFIDLEKDEKRKQHLRERKKDKISREKNKRRDRKRKQKTWPET